MPQIIVLELRVQLDRYSNRWVSENFMNRKIIFFLAGILLLILAGVIFLLLMPLPGVPVQQQKKESLNSINLPTPEPANPTTTPSSTPLRTPSQPLADWEQKLDTILTAPGDTSTAARALLVAILGLPAEAQEQFIAHALNLCEDADFSRAEEIYLRLGTPPSVSEAIFNDALNRPDEVKLPLMAKTMAHPNHPMAGESRGILELYLDLEPEASPPGSWDIAVREYLQKQRGP